MQQRRLCTIMIADVRVPPGVGAASLKFREHVMHGSLERAMELVNANGADVHEVGRAHAREGLIGLRVLEFKLAPACKALFFYHTEAQYVGVGHKQRCVCLQPRTRNRSPQCNPVPLRRALALGGNGHRAVGAAQGRVLEPHAHPAVAPRRVQGRPEPQGIGLCETTANLRRRCR